MILQTAKTTNKSVQCLCKNICNMMEFIKDINEARMTRDSSNARVLTYTDCCERLYLTMLVLEMLRKYPPFSNTVRVYAKKTSGHDSYRYFRSNGTDLYNFISGTRSDNLSFVIWQRNQFQRLQLISKPLKEIIQIFFYSSFF